MLTTMPVTRMTPTAAAMLVVQPVPFDRDQPLRPRLIRRHRGPGEAERHDDLGEPGRGDPAARAVGMQAATVAVDPTTATMKATDEVTENPMASDPVRPLTFSASSVPRNVAANPPRKALSPPVWAAMAER
jgi:hypothetical protein